jgi:hypothetical protein
MPALDLAATGGAIAFSLWGKNPKYLVGAVRNAELAPLLYPGCQPVFYIASYIPALVKERLLALGSELVECGDSAEWGDGLFWRFRIFADKRFHWAVVRDADSRLSELEALAVKAWLASGEALHVMRDHPKHQFVMLGGMWGARCEALRDIEGLLREFRASGRFANRWGTDQDFLRDVVWPRLEHSRLMHDEFFWGRPFPSPRQQFRFVGEVFDEHTQPASDWEWIRAHQLMAALPHYRHVMAPLPETLPCPFALTPAA